MGGSSALIKNGRRLMESAIGIDGSRRHLFISMVKDNRRLLLERQSSALEAMGIIVGRLVAWLSGRTSVFGRHTFSVLRSTCS